LAGPEARPALDGAAGRPEDRQGGVRHRAAAQDLEVRGRRAAGPREPRRRRGGGLVLAVADRRRELRPALLGGHRPQEQRGQSGRQRRLDVRHLALLEEDDAAPAAVEVQGPRGPLGGELHEPAHLAALTGGFHGVAESRLC
jgi:hypothetical protein